MKRKVILFSSLILLFSLSVSAQETNVEQVDFSEGNTFGSSYVDDGVIVTSSNKSGTFISRTYSFSDSKISSIEVSTDFYSENSNANVSIETSTNDFRSTRDAVKKSLRDGDQSFTVGELTQQGSYRFVLEIEDAVDVNRISIEKERKGIKLIGGNYPLIGEFEYRYQDVKVPYLTQAVAALVVFGFFSITTYWRGIQNRMKIKKFRRIQNEREA